MEFRADLHCHSTFSDGTLTPFELLDLAHCLGLQGLSITDHDTIDAYTDVLFEKAREFKIELLTGVEFSCQHNNHPVHILGYNFSLDHDGLKQFCHKHILRRKKRNQAILSKLNQIGIKLAEEDLLASQHLHVIGRPHIASLMKEKGYVTSIEEAFKKYLGEGRCCFDPGEVITVEETIKIIHDAKGKAFIAHPHLIRKTSILTDLLKLPFDGVECFYANFSLSQNKKWLDIAKKYKLLESGGSDFHGSLKPNLSLGSSYVNLESFNKIRGRV